MGRVKLPYTPGPWTAGEYRQHASLTEAAVWGPDGDAVALVYSNLGLDAEALPTAILIAAALAGGKEE